MLVLKCSIFSNISFSGFLSVYVVLPERTSFFHFKVLIM